MRKVASVVVVLFVAGCSSSDMVKKQDLDSVKAELRANDDQMAAKLRQEIMSVDQKYVSVQQIEMDVKKRSEDLDKVQKQLVEASKKVEEKVEVAGANILKVLEFEEKLLAERLSTLRALIEDLKKK